MKKAAVYTKTGDLGTTGLVGGSRVKKCDPQINLYGEVDELNSSIGAAMAFLDKSFDKDYLELIQSRLFDIGSNLACENDKRAQFKLPQINIETIKSIEEEIDKMDEVLPPLKNFILPGGHPAAALFHLSRTICRRVERQMVAYFDQNPEAALENVAVYMNRLSDYFFILSRYINFKAQIKETNWFGSK